MTIPTPPDPKEFCHARREHIVTNHTTGRVRIFFDCDRSREGKSCPFTNHLPLCVDITLPYVPGTPREFYRQARGYQAKALDSIQEGCAKRRAELQ